MAMARYRRFLTSMGVAASLVIAGPARAAFISYSAHIAPQSVPFSTGFSVQKFDSQLGTLSGVQLTLSTDISARIDVWSNLAAPTSFSNAFATFPVTVTAQSPDTTAVTATVTATLASGLALPRMPGSFINQFTGLSGTATATTTVLPSAWSFYVGLGGGSASFTATAGNGSYGGTSPFGLFFSGAGLAGGDFTVRYDFSPAATVPVPGSLGLLAGALALVGLYTGRRAVHVRTSG
jgi:hypothetical protein